MLWWAVDALAQLAAEGAELLEGDAYAERVDGSARLPHRQLPGLHLVEDVGDLRQPAPVHVVDLPQVVAAGDLRGRRLGEAGAQRAGGLVPGGQLVGCVTHAPILPGGWRAP